MKYSLTIGGVAISVIGTLLIKFGFSEGCSGEIVQLIPVFIGGAMSYIGRLRHGDINALGVKQI